MHLWFDRIDRAKTMSLILHAADISHPAKSWNLHYRWTMALMEEFFLQVPLAHYLNVYINNNIAY